MFTVQHLKYSNGKTIALAVKPLTIYLRFLSTNFNATFPIVGLRKQGPSAVEAVRRQVAVRYSDELHHARVQVLKDSHKGSIAPPRIALHVDAAQALVFGQVPLV